METKQIRKLLSKRINAVVETLQGINDDIGGWHPGDIWLDDALQAAQDELTEIVDQLANDGFASDDVLDQQDDDEDDEDDVEALDAELSFEDVDGDA